MDSVTLDNDCGIRILRKTFTKIKTFERGLAEYSYPAVVVKGDTVHITYTYERDYIVYWQIKIK